MGSHTDLLVWQRAMSLSLSLYLIARANWSLRAPGLRSQMLRAAASIPANIAEGAGQQSDARFANFLSIAIGSANELETHLALAHGLGLLTDAVHGTLHAQVCELRKMLFGLRRSLSGSR